MKKIILSLNMAFCIAVMAGAQEPDSTYHDTVEEEGRIAVMPILGAQTPEEMTSAISTVYSDDIMRSSSQNIGNALYGKILGLSAMQNVLNTASDQQPSFSIRGLQTLSQNNVLVLVDGFERPMNNITKEEVESVSVLKDAAALALYGLKGANGAILITTKRGDYDSMSASFSYEHGVAQPVRMPEFVDAYTYGLAMNEAFANDGKGYKYTQDELDAFQYGYFPYSYPDVDWWNEVIGQLGQSNIYNASFQGGGRRMRYFATVGLSNNKGFFKGTETNEGYSNQLETSKANARLNFDVDITNTTKFQFNIAGVLRETNHSRPEDVMDYLYSVPAAAFPIKTEDGIWGGNNDWPGMNPVAALQARGYSRAQERSMSVDMTLSQDLNIITPGLRIAGRLGFDNLVQYWDRKGKDYHYAFDRMVLENGLMTGNTVRIEGGTDSELAFNRSYGTTLYKFNAEGVIDYKRTFAASSLYTSIIFSGSQDVQQNANNSLNRMNISSYTHYGIKNRYFIDLALVVSGSNRLPSGHKFTFSPTLSAAWVLSNEKFLEAAKWLDLFKVRASAGIQHIDYVPSWQLTDEYFETGSNTFFTDDFTNYAGLTRGRNATQDFQPERASRLNLGVDFSAFDALAVTVDGYYQRRDHIMVATGSRISTIYGENASYEPYGIVDSYGFEVGAEYGKTFSNGLTFNLAGKFTYGSNQIVEQLEAPVNEEYLRKTGLRINQPFGLEAAGFFADALDIASSPEQLFSSVSPGDIKYIDQNEDDIINSDDFVAMGYNMTVPEIYYSFSLGLEYKGGGIDALFQGTSHISAWLDTKSVYRPLADNTNISTHYYKNRWTPDNPSARYPRLTSEENLNNAQNSSVWLADASYLKLRHCEVYWKFPEKWLKWARMDMLKIYLRGMDLFSIDKMDVFDPEAIGVYYPVQRSFHLGINVTF